MSKYEDKNIKNIFNSMDKQLNNSVLKNKKVKLTVHHSNEPENVIAAAKILNKQGYKADVYKETALSGWVRTGYTMHIKK